MRRARGDVAGSPRVQRRGGGLEVERSMSPRRLASREQLRVSRASRSTPRVAWSLPIFPTCSPSRERGADVGGVRRAPRRRADQQHARGARQVLADEFDDPAHPRLEARPRSSVRSTRRPPAPRSHRSEEAEQGKATQCRRPTAPPGARATSTGRTAPPRRVPPTRRARARCCARRRHPRAKSSRSARRRSRVAQDAGGGGAPVIRAFLLLEAAKPWSRRDGASLPGAGARAPPSRPPRPGLPPLAAPPSPVEDVR